MSFANYIVAHSLAKVQYFHLMIALRPIHTVRFVIITCSIQLISHRVNVKIAPALVN